MEEIHKVDQDSCKNTQGSYCYTIFAFPGCKLQVSSDRFEVELTKGFLNWLDWTNRPPQGRSILATVGASLGSG